MGQVLSGGESRPVTAEDLRAVQQMRRESLTRVEIPTLQHRDNPHEYLYFAFFDGTGQDLNNPKLGPPTNIGVMYEQAKRLEDDPNNRIGAHYSEGIGTHGNALRRAKDGMLASTWADGIEKAYADLARQTKKWKDADPEAQIRIVGAGYSRGAVQEAGFHRLVDKYGILPRDNLNFGRDEHGNITVESLHPPLAPPGQVAQFALLLDPVATGFPRNYDARLPPSAIGRVSLLARDEQREWFNHQAINDPGLSPDGRAINAPTAGGHSNVGGGNEKPGLEILNGNAAIDVLNLVRDEPLFEKRPVPADLSAITVYQARGATSGFGFAMDGDGKRDLREELANCKIVDPCRDSDPVDQALAARFEYRRVQLDPVEQAQIESLIGQAESRDARQPTATQPGLVPVPDVTSTVPAPTAPTFQSDDIVRQVATLQSGLIQMGYHQRISQPLQVNGHFDDATKQAVTAFQAQQNLPITSSFDAATQQALQQMLLAQQQASEQRQTEDKTRHQDERKSEQGRSGERNAELLPYSDPRHCEQQIYATLANKLDQRGQLQEVSKEQLHGMAAQMHWEGFKPDWQGDAMVRSGRVIAQDTQGHRAAYDLRQPTQLVDATMQEVRDVDRHMAQVQEAHRQQDLTRPPPGPGQPGGPPLP